MKEQAYFDKRALLEPENMLLMYAQGAFPMADEDGELEWYQPTTRAILPLDNFNVPRSLRQYMNECDFEYRYDYDFESVIRNCADRDTTWISEDLITAYDGLINLGNLHTVEVYKDNELVGGLYGVAFRKAFFGESMFSYVEQASKCALVKLVEKLNNASFQILDIQFITDHLKMFGAVEISFDQFKEMLLKAYK
jgi:leucyl/phenylalanyl-tRNA--protein transferase